MSSVESSVIECVCVCVCVCEREREREREFARSMGHCGQVCQNMREHGPV